VGAEVVVELRDGLEELVRLVRSLPEDRLERPQAEGWTARKVLAHLADHELMAAARVRLVLSRECPPLPAYGQEEFTDRFSGLEAPADALERFAVNRTATLRVLEVLAPEDWARVGAHPVRGEESLRRTMEYLVRHDRGHLAQLRLAAGA
jgi:uncharacterized protein (TIGR03083 family)